MEREKGPNESDLLFVAKDGKKVYGTPPPPDIKERVEKAKERDFELALKLLGKEPKENKKNTDKLPEKTPGQNASEHKGEAPQ